MYGGGESKWRPGGEYVLQLSIYNFLAFLLIFQTSQLLKKAFNTEPCLQYNERLLVIIET